MKVRELIERLNEFDQELEVQIDTTSASQYDTVLDITDVDEDEYGRVVLEVE